jgi:hypothetical protein
MDSEKRFKTKTGYCHILPEKIVLTRDGDIENIANLAVSKGVPKILIIYGLLAGYLIYRGVSDFQHGEHISASIWGLLGLYLVVAIFRSMNNSATPIIERKSIQNIKFIKGIKGITRARFEIKFIDNNRKVKTRLILLPGSLSGGDSAADNALRLMTEEGFCR